MHARYSVPRAWRGRGPFGIRIGQDDQEFLTTEACQEISCPYYPGQDNTQLPENVVTRLVAVRIVDCLEMIGVHHQHAVGTAGALQAQELEAMPTAACSKVGRKRVSLARRDWLVAWSAVVRSLSRLAASFKAQATSAASLKWTGGTVILSPAPNATAVVVRERTDREILPTMNQASPIPRPNRTTIPEASIPSVRFRLASRMLQGCDAGWQDRDCEARADQIL